MEKKLYWLVESNADLSITCQNLETAMENNFYQKYHLSTDGYHFKYRHDNNNPEVVRATLYNLKDERVDDVRKTEGYGLREKSHHDIINYFEARLSIGAIK